MNTELTTTHSGSTLTIDPGQTEFTDTQRSALAQIGVEEASDGDLRVFFHVCKRSGLDPFARQIHMVGRPERQQDGSYRTKYTIQTGIDGYRLIGRRAADRSKSTVRVDAPQWAHQDGSWRDLWSAEWGMPLAARVTIHRDGDPFTAVAMFAEYAQTKKNGDLTRMWAQRPAGQLAKCAEAAAWRMAFPQDLAGLYTDDEMGRADSAVVEVRRRTGGLSSALNQEPTPEPQLLDVESDLAKSMYAAITENGIDKEGAKHLYADVTGRQVESSRDLFEYEARDVLRHLKDEPVDAEIVEHGDAAAGGDAR